MCKKFGERRLTTIKQPTNEEKNCFHFFWCVNEMKYHDWHQYEVGVDACHVTRYNK